MSRELRSGDVVWVLRLGISWWPGYIADPFKGKFLPPQVVDGTRDEVKVRLFPCGNSLPQLYKVGVRNALPFTDKDLLRQMESYDGLLAAELHLAIHEAKEWVNQAKFKIGTIAWARLGSFPFWPVRVLEPQDYNFASLQQVECFNIASNHLPDNHCLVEFFNDDNSISVVPKSEMRPLKHPGIRAFLNRYQGKYEKQLKTALENADRSVTKVMATMKSFKSGDLVWAHVYSYPWWPARVVRPKRSLLDSLKLSNIPKGHRLVWFYRDHNRYAVLGKGDIKKFVDNSIRKRVRSHIGKCEKEVRAAVRVAMKTTSLNSLLKQGGGGSLEKQDRRKEQTGREEQTDRNELSRVEESAGPKKLGNAASTAHSDSPIVIVID